MKKFILGMIMILGVSLGYAQSSIKWVSNEHDFGAFKEDLGYVTCVFKGVNIAKEPISIVSARATCGCTTPKYSRNAFAPGDTIAIEVSYDPASRPGRFMKKVYLKNSNDAEQSELRIRGVVIGNEATLKSRYPIDCGKLRLQNNIAAIGELERGRAKAVFINVYNQTTDTVVPSLANVPSYIKTSITPNILPPGEQASIAFHFDAFYYEKWGIVNDSINLITDSQNAQTITIDVTANILPDFRKMTPGERMNAPKIEFDDSYVDFGRVDRSVGTITREFEVKNSGENPLLIHRVYSLEEGIEVDIDKDKIKGGKTTKVKVTVHPDQYKGKMLNATVKFVVNDPDNPQPMMRVVGEWK